MDPTLFKKSGNHRPWLADGAMGTLLLREGYSDYGVMYLLNIERPEIIQRIHRAYVEAGAQIIYTHTFAAGLGFLKRSQIEDKFVAINRSGVANAREVASPGVYIAGNLCPDHSEGQDERRRVKHTRQQLDILISEGVDLIAAETITDMSGIRCLMEALAGIPHKNLPVLISVSPVEDGELHDKTALADWVRVLNEAAIDLIGVNCVRGPESILKILSHLVTESRHPVAIKPNAGVPLQRGGETIYSVDAQTFCSQMKGVMTAAVAIIGGCCGTDPHYIRRLHEELNRQTP